MASTKSTGRRQRRNPFRQLHDDFLLAANDMNSLSSLLSEHIFDCFHKSRIRLTKVERAAIETAAAQIAAGANVDILRELPIIRTSRKVVDLAPSEMQIDALLARRMNAIQGAADRIVKRTAKKIERPYRNWARNASAEEGASLEGFRTRLARQWRTPFELLSAFRVACTSIGIDLMADLRLRAGRNRKLSAKRSALFLFHARACIVASEIEWLLRGGFADGGMARWRTLHEIAVMSAFIGSQSEKVAKRFIKYEDIESQKAAALYQQFSPRLHVSPLDEGELKRMVTRKSKLVEVYGREFVEDNGWAADEFDGKAPSFAAIEKRVGLDHLRPYYKLASQQTHASPKGMKFRMGLMDSYVQGRDVMLVGPTNLGLADSAQLTSLSLLQTTMSLVGEDATLDSTVLLIVMSRLQDEVASNFLRIENSIRRREERLRKGEATTPGTRNFNRN